ncbi:MAG: MFS transporter [Pseudomonadota bacterium]
MSTEIAASPTSSLSALQRAALPMLFTLLGVTFATWASRIPAIRDGLHLSAAQLGLVLLCGGIGAVGSFPISAWMIARFGARHTVLYAGIVLLVGMLGIPLSPNMAVLMIMLIGFGACSSVFDVAINVAGSEAEKIAGRSIMSMLHAWFCVGTFSGALFGSAMAALEYSPTIHFGLITIVLVLPFWLGYGALPNDQPDPDAGKKSFALPHGALVALALIGFCGAIAEGSIADWSGIYMKDHMGATEGVAPLAYAAFAAMMLGARLVCDRLKDQFGARRVVFWGALLSACGVFLAVVAPNVPVAIIGFALSGIGVASIFPFIFSAAGRHGSTAMAGVATLSYSGGLIGPPIIGFIAQGLGLQLAMGFIALLSIGVAIAAQRAKSLE